MTHIMTLKREKGRGVERNERKIVHNLLEEQSTAEYHCYDHNIRYSLVTLISAQTEWFYDHWMPFLCSDSKMLIIILSMLCFLFCFSFLGRCALSFWSYLRLINVMWVQPFNKMSITNIDRVWLYRNVCVCV